VTGVVRAGVVAILVFEDRNTVGSRHIVGGVYSNIAGLWTGMTVPCDINPAVLWSVVDLGVWTRSMM
jgi:hypothetical protein